VSSAPEEDLLHPARKQIPTCDQDNISPYNNTTLSMDKVRRIEKHSARVVSFAVATWVNMQCLPH